MKDFAIIKKATDSLLTVERGDSAAALEGRYPPADFSIVDMTGKSEIPWKEGTTTDDLTVVDGEWSFKVSDAEIATRKKNRRKKTIRRDLVLLKIQKDKATSLGAGFESVLGDIDDKIVSLETELGGL